MPLSPGDKVDRYRILARLGAGGMGEVYRAHDVRLQRDVALKILHPNAASGSASESTTEGAARLLREARSVAALDHPNIITIHDVGEVAEPEELRGTPYIAMELIKGKSLREHLAEGTPVPLAQRIAWLSGAATALGAAHDAGIVHRDVKPENIMIRDDGVAKVLDFGIAKRSFSATSVDPTSSTEAQLLPQLTTRGVVIGTPYYMAPEQMRSEALDGRADQFSWGVVAYEVLTGKPPWNSGGDALQLVSEILSHEPVPPSTRNPEIPRHVDAVVMRALAKSRDGRFPSMSDAVAALSAPTGSAPRVYEASMFAATMSAMPLVPPAPGAIVPSSSAAPPGAPLRSKRRAWGLLSLIVIALSVAAVAATGRRPGALAPSPVASASSNHAVATRSDFPDYGSTMSKSAAAEEAYRAGMSSLRDANQDRAIRQLDRAVREDPTFAAAHLRYALTSGIPLGDAERAHLQEATRMRASLGPHDQILVDAFAPVSSAPGDLVETEKRLADATARFPTNADFVLQLCRARLALGAYASAIATCTRANELDPEGATALRVRAMAQMHTDDVPGALASLDACLRISPLGTWCLAPLTQLRAFEGDCEHALTAARRLVSADPESSDSYDMLADILMGTGAPLESVQTALADELERTPPSQAPIEKLREQALVAIQTSDFVTANALLHTWDDAIASSRQEEAHFLLSTDRIALALEEGRSDDAKALAATYLAHRPAWTTIDDDDRSIYFTGTLYRTGAISRDEFGARRSKWLAWKKAQPPGNRYGSALGFAWIAAYAEPAITSDDARESLEALPAYLPLPDPMMRSPDFEEPIGKVYRLAGRDADALPFLTRASRSCFGLSSSFALTRANLELGEALEALGDRTAACEAYRVVTRHWGRAGTSLTARRAKARIRSIGCPP